MRSEFWIPPIALLATLAACGSLLSSQERLFVFNYENILGTSLELKMEAQSSAAANRADVATRREIARESAILSAWDSQSEFSRWNATIGQPVSVSRELFEMLSLFDAWRERTGGALDASAETVIRVWQNAATEGREPSRAALDAAVEAVRRPHWALNPAARSAIHLDAAPIALNSFAKSYIGGHAAAAALAQSGVHSVVVNIGGDLVIRGPRSEMVDIADPRCFAENCPPLAQLEIRGRAIATSGNYRRGVEIAGRHYSHIVDPRTGMTAEDVISSTVAAPNAADAGAMATAFSVLSPAESAKIAASQAGVDYLIVTSTGERFASLAWSRFAARPPQASRFAAYLQAAAPQAPGAWDPEFKLEITIELAHLDGSARRPFLAVWIEDAARKPVRTIALWYHKDRYLPEMSGWFRVAQASAAKNPYQFAHSIAGATRPPGKYTFEWDGKDDSGKLVAAGTYTVVIEAAREHGTHQLMHQAMDFNGVPAKIDLKGNTEISGASLDYRKTAVR